MRTYAPPAPIIYIDELAKLRLFFKIGPFTEKAVTPKLHTRQLQHSACS